MSPQPDIKDLSFDELSRYLTSIGEKVFRATQIFEWIYQKGAKSFDAMSNLSASLRSRLKIDFNWGEEKIAQEERARDGTTKFLFELKDREKIETVLIPIKERATICISTQAGCKFGCRFCASGIGGWSRNLSSGEILTQILHVEEFCQKTFKRPLTNIVFMGVGEPLDNYENLLKAIRVINSAKGLNMGARRITISTCGVVPKIKKLAREGLQIELAVSLHGSSNESRDVLMPVNKKYPIEELISACREYIEATNRQITFEYILIKDVTCALERAEELGRLLKDMLCKINLIPYNPVSEFDHKTPTLQEMKAFKKRLEELRIHATLRTPRGRDVAGACGQLRHATSRKQLTDGTNLW